MPPESHRRATAHKPKPAVTRTRDCRRRRAADLFGCKRPPRRDDQDPPPPPRSPQPSRPSPSAAPRGHSPAATAAATRTPASEPRRAAYGVSALITPLDAFDVLNGHVAGWVGVGGPGQGPNGTERVDPGRLRRIPEHHRQRHLLRGRAARPLSRPTTRSPPASDVGTLTKVTVLEIHGRANWWRVWVNHKPVSPPIHLPDSHGRWSPIATAESWDGGTGGTCNTFLYRFRHVSVAHAPGGGWHQLTGGYPIQSAATRIQRAARFLGLPRGGRPAGLPAPLALLLDQDRRAERRERLELPRPSCSRRARTRARRPGRAAAEGWCRGCRRRRLPATR